MNKNKHKFPNLFEVVENELNAHVRNWEKEVTTDPSKGLMCAWAAYYYIARIALPVIRVFRENNKKELPEGFCWGNEQGGYDEPQDWNETLEKIEIAFTYFAYNHSKNKDEQKMLKNIYQKYTGAENPSSNEMQQFYRDYVNEGCKLFGKYFRILGIKKSE